MPLNDALVRMYAVPSAASQPNQLARPAGRTNRSEAVWGWNGLGQGARRQYGEGGVGAGGWESV